MKIFLCMSCLVFIFAGCLIRQNSDVSTVAPNPKLLEPLNILYGDKYIKKLENLHDVNKVSDDDVASIKKLLHETLTKIVTSLPTEIDHRNTRISFIPEGGIISYYSNYNLCETEDRSKCFRLELTPIQLQGYSGFNLGIKVWQLPANKDLAKVSSSYSDDKLPNLLKALQGLFPHRLEDGDLTVRYYSRGDDRTLLLIAGSARTDNRRELHIKTIDGTIDNTSNALFPYTISPADVATLDDNVPTP